MMKWRQVMNGKRLRWVLVADEICFTSRPLAIFFSLGKAIPVIRGEGIHQKPMDFALEKLDQGGWVHVFPEGMVYTFVVALFLWLSNFHSAFISF
jgi:monolysocardiolipin acyltransferase